MKKIVLCFLCFVASLQADPRVDALKQRVCKTLPSLEGWCSEEKAIHFIDLVLETKPDLCVEIGVFGGSSLYPVVSALKFLKKGVVIGIDPWDRLECIQYFDPVEDKANIEWWGLLDLNKVYESYQNVLRKYALEKYCITIKKTAEKAAAEVGTIDILYIDGNHSEVMSTKDVTLYLPKVRSGGYIWINDTLWPTMQKAVELLSGSCDAIKLIDNGNCILFKKK
jgi:Cephalosporin hydroxylase.